MQIVSVIMSLLWQPLLWLGLLSGFLVSYLRITKERSLFRIAVDNHYHEFRHFFTWGVPFGIGLSIVSLLIGFRLPLIWVQLYELIAGLVLLLSIWRFVPLLGLLVTSLIVMLVAPDVSSQLVPNVLVLSGAAALFTALLIHRLGAQTVSPRIRKSSRGRRTGFFRLRQLAFVPLVMLVPVKGVTTSAWPTFQFGGGPYSLFILPLFLGFLLTVKHQQIMLAVKQTTQWYLIEGGLLLILGILGQFLTNLTNLFLILAICLEIGGHIWRYFSARSGSIHYTEPFVGISVLGIQPGTPAAKMDLIKGDTILDCNHIAINDEDSFYRALMTNPTYCHLRIKTITGDIKITETAIFADSPHEVGVITFPKKGV
ncbi:hypothetical protein [Loigolactobacillus backii]|uniref:Uncharacterized protein n=1 Tax=Loigolactobacillus backii TaxID=375175 RepID=A0A192H533_9LACO|nr:hypothetical protein [Loigolactobacillus backii]ANK59990.1 hypothetical protein AYR52_06775 [Loigolactobacillus backii]ANK63327.1 hypothetical protein AYR53_11435 [Loigolactobacillus backii]ANK64924.1 hypothetical protein AYR54_06455 [Loigolactobacillus backii]ANK66629.1 hypothetical protein AYR55_02305 [Loigolactobacillus backii]ANK69668.1 hypothetical protein AYR56_05570 [Loigolactobacillus backii]